MKKQDGFLGSRSGCKVGWNYYRTREQAEAAKPEILERAAMMQSKGYDFGFQVPGHIEETEHKEYGNCFMITTS